MVTKQELVNGYETEIKYQRHMLENLGRWFSLLFIIASIGVVLIYLFHKSFLPLLILGILLALVRNSQEKNTSKIDEMFLKFQFKIVNF